MTKIMLFGPPAIGKSTIIHDLRDGGVDAFDLEDIADTRAERLNYFYASDHVIYAAADLPVDVFIDDPEVLCVLLT